MKKLLVAAIILSLVAACGLFVWKAWKSGGDDGPAISIPRRENIKGVINKDTIGVQKNEDGSFIFTDTPGEGMTIIELPSPEQYKGDRYSYGPGIVLPPDPEADE